MDYVVAALYHFAPVVDPEALRDCVKARCRRNGIRGTLLIAHEGINGTIAGTPEGLDDLLKILRQQPGFAALVHKESAAEERPFRRLKVRVKDEIVTMRQPNVCPADRVGTYVDPEAWNALIAREDVLLVDTRNDFEYRVGHFDGAVNPETAAFTDFAGYVAQNLDIKRHRHVAMYCTGGIRCEKASSYMLGQGFESVYHLKGGILSYLEQIPKADSTFRGECFVFDQRVALGHGLKAGTHTLCFGCRMPLSTDDRQDPTYENGVSCPHCIDELTPERKASLRERRYQVNIAAARGYDHIGDNSEDSFRHRSAKPTV